MARNSKSFAQHPSERCARGVPYCDAERLQREIDRMVATMDKRERDWREEWRFLSNRVDQSYALVAILLTVLGVLVAIIIFLMSQG